MQVGVGYSDIPDSKSAGIQAVESALEKSGRQDNCDLLLLFCTARHNEQVLRDAAASIVGDKTPIYGGGAVGVITNEVFGYAGDQVGAACIWFDGGHYDVLEVPGLTEGEEQAGIRLGSQMKEIGIGEQSPVMMFYDPVNLTESGMQLQMATWLLAGIEKGLGCFPNMVGAGIQGDHNCTPTAMFLGDKLGEHAVMAMTFPPEVQLDSSIMHGCRPASQYYTVTKAQGPVILEINGEPAIPFIDKLLDSAITPEQYPFFLMFGINHGERWAEYDENNYASRLCLAIDKEHNGIVMFEPDMVEGTEFQLMFRSLDLDYMKPKIESLFETLEQQEREPVFAMYINCAGRCAGYGGMDIEDAVALQKIVNNRAPLLGIYTGVEIAQIGGRPRGLDWTGVFCLFSKSKDGKVTAPPPKPVATWESQEAEAGSKEVPVDAALRLGEQNVAKVLALDTQLIAIRQELEQKRRGFALLSELTVSLRQATDYGLMFELVARRINAALNMQKTAVLAHKGDGVFVASVLQGFSEEEKAALEGKELRIDAELLDPERPVLVNSTDAPERFAEIRKELNLPYFVSAPAVLQDEVEALLITGRTAEQVPFLLRLGTSDMETVQAIVALMVSMLVHQHLDEAEARTRIMLDATPLCCNFWDSEGNNIDCNLEAVRMFRLKDKREYLERFAELSPEYQPSGEKSSLMAARYVKRAFEDGHMRFEWLHQTLDGEPVPTEVVLVRVAQKREYIVVGYTRDLRELKANLAAMEQTQAELLEARDRAEESARAKSQFLANMSHEIRTPMNAIIGMTEIAKKSEDLDKTQYCLDKINHATEHLLGIINDILDMSKMDSREITLSLSEFGVEDMLAKVSDIIAFELEEKNLDFLIKLDRDVPAAIISDQQRLTQVFTNLLTNTVKFTPEGGKISLLVHNADEDAEACTLYVEVIDTGIGISEEQQTKLFQTFEQVDGSISRRFGGTGIGLAIAKNIVEMLGGQIWVESELEKGSRFQFTVRVKKGSAGSINKLDDSLAGKDIRLLVIDDEQEMLDYFKDIAELLGVSCDTATDLDTACKMLDASKGEGAGYNMVFVDWNLPGTDGVAAAEKIRQHYENYLLLMISTIGWTQNEEQAKKAGIDRFVAKPLLPSFIAECINECALEDTHISEELTIVPDEIVDFTGKTLLLAEDIEINREILISLLEDTGLTIEWGENGKIVCDMFRSNPEKYDIILMDIHMPEMDGYQATREIRAMDLPQAATVPIVAMTANVFPEDVERCLASGMNGHLGKPVDIDLLTETLQEYMGR